MSKGFIKRGFDRKTAKFLEFAMQSYSAADKGYHADETESVLLVKSPPVDPSKSTQTKTEYRSFFPDPPLNNGPPIFFDPSGWRHYAFKTLAIILLIFSIVWSALFVQSMLSSLPIHGHFQNSFLSHKVVHNFNEGLHDSDIPSFPGDMISTPIQTGHTHTHANTPLPCGDASSPIKENSETSKKIQRSVFGFLPPEPDWSHLSLRGSCGVIDVLMAEWFEINHASPTLKTTASDPAIFKAVDDYLNIQHTNKQLFPVVTIRDPKVFLKLSTVDYRDQVIFNIDQIARSIQAGGICIQANADSNQSIHQLKVFIETLNAKIKQNGLKTCVIVNQNTLTKSNAETFQGADYVVVKMFRENWIGSSPSPLAAQEEFKSQVIIARKKLGADKLVVALGNFATDWISGQPLPEVIGYSEAISRISKSRAKINYSPTALNSFSTFTDGKGKRHQIWLLDAVSAFNEIRVLDDLGISNIAIWSLGFEDPSIWRMLNSQIDDASLVDKVLSNISLENTVNYEGSGTFFKFISEAKKGARKLTFSDDGGKILHQEYTKLPQATRIERYGAPKPAQVALTFDDGPDRKFTTAILDTLKETNTPATFFVVGENMLKEPALIKRIYDDGHEIGSHTFWHSKMDEISHTRSYIELNAVQKILIDITGHATKLFREPFLRSQGPFSVKESEATQIAQSQGYIIAGSDIVPPDWTGISAKEIEEFVVGKVIANEGKIILLHDAGNDRSETVAAVPKIIEALRSEGYEIVPLSEVLDTDRNSLMPSATNYQDIVPGLTFRFASNVWDAFNYIFWFVIIFGVIRSITILILAMLRRPPMLDPDYHFPDVTVIIPAFNEEKVVQDCLKSVLQSDYPNLKVIVVDDGSNDETLHEVLRKISDRNDVQLICQLNHGKWRALNAAYSIIDTEIAVSIDADTRIEADTIKNLVRHFQNPKVGAVAGKVVVGNRINFLSKLQALEYIVAQNIDRRAAELFNGILVVPGAIGAWRVSAVREAGLYSGVTQTEDADLTISLNRSGYRVIHEQFAVGITEAPTTIQALLTQRLRWSLGMLQNGWKHRGAMLKFGFLGQVALPDLLIFGYLFALLAPIADLYFFTLLFKAISSMIENGVSTVKIENPIMIGAYLILPLLDTITAFIAIRNDKSESYLFLLLLPLQRLLYRQLLYIAVFRAIFKACSGRASKWGKLERTGKIYSSEEVG